ncbi:hypothetical protein [Microcoleus sp. BROC3]|uniref:hypothetical protein n=1 Tax=Microcoleus sp. BROC3 TaxID=3055323 RepID=UPI002FD6C461
MTKKGTKKVKLVMTHLHNRIAKLAKGAIERGDITSCDRISDSSYLIKRIDKTVACGREAHRPQTTKYTTVAAASLLHLLNSYAKANPPSETLAETETV